MYAIRTVLPTASGIFFLPQRHTADRDLSKHFSEARRYVWFKNIWSRTLVTYSCINYQESFVVIELILIWLDMKEFLKTFLPFNLPLVPRFHVIACQVYPFINSLKDWLLNRICHLLYYRKLENCLLGIAGIAHQRLKTLQICWSLWLSCDTAFDSIDVGVQLPRCNTVIQSHQLQRWIDHFPGYINQTLHEVFYIYDRIQGSGYSKNSMPS